MRDASPYGSVRFSGLWLIGLSLTCLGAWSGPIVLADADSPPTPQHPVTVRLKDGVTLPERSVRLGDIADVRSADARAAAAAEQLEIISIEDVTGPLVVSRKYVRIRLVLDGWALEDIRIDGATECRILMRDPEVVTDAAIELSARSALEKSCGLQGDELTVRLASPVMSMLPERVRQTDGLLVEVLPPAKNPLGTVMLTARFWDDEKLVAGQVARFEVLRRFRVAVTEVSLRRNQVLDKSMFRLEQRYLPAEADELTSEMIVGRRLRGDLKVGSVLSLRDLEDDTTAAPQRLIRKADRIPVVARGGTVRVSLQAAEALQDGREGDMIAVKNMESGRVFRGRVTANGGVEVRVVR